MKVTGYVSTILGVLLISATATTSSVTPSFAQGASTGKSGLPLPRYVSLKSKRVNMRVGPGKQYQVIWLYQKPGLPMEIIQEFDNWRKVRDPQGNEGWILHSLLSGVRTAVVRPWEEDLVKGLADLKEKPGSGAAIRARLEPGVLAKVDSCDDEWCKVSIQDTDGYIMKTKIWGVYPDERIEN